MRQPKPHPPKRSQPDARRRPAAPPPSAATARERDDENVPPETPEAGFRVSSYELKRGLDVVELPTSLPPEVLDRLFKSR